MTDIYHVLPDDDDGWLVVRDGVGTVDRAFTRGVAIETARRRAKATVLGRLVIHHADGSVESEETYARDGRASPGIGQRVLVIDDDPGVRTALSRILQAGGYRAEEAVDGFAGIDAMVRGRFALVITDVIMPGLDGIETILRIRDLDPTVPIIAISGGGDANYSPLQDAKLFGATRTIAKPFTVEQILSAAGELIGLS